MLLLLLSFSSGARSGRHSDSGSKQIDEVNVSVLFSGAASLRTFLTLRATGFLESIVYFSVILRENAMFLVTSGVYVVYGLKTVLISYSSACTMGVTSFVRSSVSTPLGPSTF